MIIILGWRLIKVTVLFVAASSGCYGADNSLLDMIKALRKKVEVIVFLPESGEIEEELLKNDIEYYIIPYTVNASLPDLRYRRFGNAINNMLFLSDAKKIIKQRQVDIIHTNTSNVDFGAWLSTISGVPHVWHIREVLEEAYPLRYDFPYIERLLRKRADCLILISKFVKENAIIGKRNVVLYNGFDLEKYTIDKKDLFSNGRMNLLCYGQITKEKGVMDSIKAVQVMTQRGQKNVILNIVGAKGKYCMELMKYVNESHLNDHIVFWGHQKKIRRFLEEADIVLSCSVCEGLGRVTVEGMLGECLVFGANAGATPELIKNGVTGYLYSAGNFVELAEKIIYAYGNKEESRAIVKKAKMYAVKHFDSKIYAKSMINIYESIRTKR